MMLCNAQADGFAPQAHRWALLGNAVSVHVAAWIGKALMHPHRHKYQGARDRRFIGMSVPPEAEEGGSTHSARASAMQSYQTCTVTRCDSPAQALMLLRPCP